jgi:hypothetical protein
MDLIDEVLGAGKRQLTPKGEPLRNRKKISDLWPQLPSEGWLQVYVRVESTAGGEHFIRLFAPLPDI